MIKQNGKFLISKYYFMYSIKRVRCIKILGIEL